MIYIDDQNLIHRAAHEEGVYHIDVPDKCSKVKKVLLDGVEALHVIFCDTNQGFLIKGQQAIDGKMIVRQDQLAYEIKLGKVEVILDGMEWPPAS